MTLTIYNTALKKKIKFEPLVPGKIGLYICGVTVYDDCHIGHARTFTAFDTIVRYLRYREYQVTYIRNITDIDDKIIKRAQEKKQSVTEMTNHYIQAMQEDFQNLNLLTPDKEPRATEYMPQMIALIQKLQDKGYAYVGKTGDVYYRVRKFERYGCLAHRALQDLQLGARVEVNEAKDDPLDFVLWKPAKPGEPSWPSPWGDGRPGWHLECSAMSMDLLGETFDIHGGGFDLIFPHHENECAQSEAATDVPFVKTWMHTGFLKINKEKMSKSLGNFATIREIVAHFHHEVIRHFMISGHYRSPLEYNYEKIQLSQSALERLYLALRGLPLPTTIIDIDRDNNYVERFNAAMDDDFNTPEALAVLFDLAREINRKRADALDEAVKLGAILQKLSQVLGLLNENPQDYLTKRAQQSGVNIEDIEQLIEIRELARSEKDWQQADQIREQLITKGIIIEDTPAGTLWRKKS